MNFPLEQAFAQMDLQPGQIYRFNVKGRRVELRVLDDTPAQLLPAPFDEADVMLDAWAELPGPGPGVPIRVTPGKLPPPDVPEIPTDGDEG